MYANILLKTARDRYVGILVGVLAVAAMFALGMAAYSGIDPEFIASLPSAYLELLGIPEGADAGSLAFGAIFTTMGALTISGLAVSMGTASIAREEANGTLDLLLGNPKSRTHVLLSKAGSLVLLMALAALVLWGASYVIPSTLDVSTTGIEIEALVLHLLVNSVFYGFLAMAIGAWSGNAGAASGVSAGVMVLGLLAVGMLPLTENLAWVARFFPWYYFAGSEPISNGVDWAHIAILTGASAVLVVVAYLGVNRRDLKTAGVKRTILDRLRDNPRTARIVERFAGSARVSGIVAKTASDHQGLMVATGMIIFYVTLIIGAFWTLLPEGIFDALESFPDGLTAAIGGANMATPEGWLQGETFVITGPIVMFALTIAIGSRALAGEEQRHTMGLLMASPISRSRIILEKTLLMVIYALILGTATFIGTWLGALIGGLGVSVEGMVAASLLLVLLGLVIGGVTLLLGAATGKPSIATYGGVGVGLISYVAFSFLPLSDRLADWAEFSPFHFYLGSDPLVNGMNWGHAGVLTGLFIILVAASIPLFQRRDLRE
jgi:ABC-2 type transport system permease protein